MKKLSLWLFSLLLLIPFTVKADNPKVKTLSTENNGFEIIFNGTIENDSHAVMCKLYDNNEKEIDLLSVEVDKGAFNGSFVVSDKGKYTITCANYEGGEIKNVDTEIKDFVTYNIEFNTNGAGNIDSIKVEGGKALVVNLPNPTRKGYVFLGWYIDEKLTNEFDPNKEITSNISLYAKWKDDENYSSYKVEDKNGTTITFKEETGHNYSLTFQDLLPLTDEELASIDATREEYNFVLKGVEDATKDYGKVLAFYNIEVIDENNQVIHEGPFEVRIKLSDDMKKFNTFKLVYIDDNFKTETPVELRVEGDYLVGTLPHLSAYALLGSIVDETSNPKTFDNIYLWAGLMGVSLIGIGFSVLKIKKAKVK